jgi:hypothetical protein
MNILLAADPTSEKYLPIQEKLYDAAIEMGATICRISNEIEPIDGVVAELSSQSESVLEAVRYGIDLQKPMLILASKYGRERIPDEFIDVSKINPNGILYSRDHIAVIALRVFISAHLKGVLPHNLDKLNHPIQNDPEAKGLSKKDLEIAEDV